MRHRILTSACALSVFIGAAFPVLADDIEHGRSIYKTCSSCHSIDSDRNSFGPSLKSIVGRKAASAPGYAYSPAMQAAGAAGLIWDEQALADFVTNPQAKVPGNKMRFWGLWKSQVGDLIAYLKASGRSEVRSDLMQGSPDRLSMTHLCDDSRNSPSSFRSAVAKNYAGAGTNAVRWL